MAQGSGPTVQGIQKISVATEAAGAFATEIVWPSGGADTFIDCPIVEGSASWTTDVQMLDPGNLVQYHHDYREEVVGKKSATLTFTMNLASTGTAATAAQSALQGALGKILKVVMGGEATLATGSQSSTGATATAVSVDQSTGKWTSGMAAGWVNGSSVLEIRELQTVAAKVLTPKLAYSGAATVNDEFHNCATYFLAADPNTSLQFVVQGMEQEDRWLISGCQGSLTLNLPLDGSIPTVTFAFQCATWVQVADAGGTAMVALDGTDLTVATYTNVDPITAVAGDFRVPILGTESLTAATQVHVSALAIEPQHNFVPITSPSGTNGILRFRLSRNNGPSVQGSWTTFYESDGRWDARAAKTDYALFYQFGQSAGSSVLISCPTIQVVDVQRVDDNGIAGETVTWKARADGDITASGTADQQRSPLRIHLG